MKDIDASLHKVPPQNLEAEQSVLGGILLDNLALNTVLEVLETVRLLQRCPPEDLLPPSSSFPTGTSRAI